MHAYAAHRFWSGAGFSSVVADPGLVDTTLNREWPPFLRGAYVVVSRALGLLSRSSDGAQAVLHACFLPPAVSPPGRAHGRSAALSDARYLYGSSGAELSPSAVVREPGLQNRIWTVLNIHGSCHWPDDDSIDNALPP